VDQKAQPNEIAKTKPPAPLVQVANTANDSATESETEPKSEPNPKPTCAMPAVDQKAHVQAINNMADDLVMTESESKPEHGARLRPHAHHVVRYLNLFVLDLIIGCTHSGMFKIGSSLW